MKKYILSTISMLVLLCTANGASPQIAPYGWRSSGDELTFTLPTTQLSVTLVVEKSEFKAGEYARYGSKFLGISCELADKSSYNIINSSINLVDPYSLYSNNLASDNNTSKAIKAHTQLSQSGTMMSEENRARDAATRIFTIRRQRQELVSGDVGEGVFGEGLNAALQTLQTEEQQLLSLFIGETHISTQSRSFSIQPNAETKNYIICRFSPSEGIVSTSTLSASPVYLQITDAKMPAINEAKANDKGQYAASVMEYAVAAQCQCTLFNDMESINEIMLPIFEFGRICKLNLPRQYQILHFGQEIK